MQTKNPAPARRTPLATKIGLGLWAVTLVWWFAYYAQYAGAFDLLGLKFMCITGATSECEFFQQRLGSTAIPAYRPVFWWAGCVAMMIGFFQDRAARRSRVYPRSAINDAQVGNIRPADAAEQDSSR